MIPLRMAHSAVWCIRVEVVHKILTSGGSTITVVMVVEMHLIFSAGDW
jgi:hypothetical protein